MNKALKNFQIVFLTLASCILSSCMDGGYDDPDSAVPPFGNDSIAETNVISVAQLRELYPNASTSTSYKKIEDDAQLKVVVGGNDIEGNLYREVAVQDNTGALSLSISQGGLFGHFPEGAELLIDLKGLYIGNYGEQLQLAAYPAATEYTYASVHAWESHYKLTGNVVDLEPEEFYSNGRTWNAVTDGGKLGIIKDVSFRGVSPTMTYSDPNGTSSVSLYFKEYSGTNLMVYTSMYCDFAGMVVPQGKCNVTGIFKNFRGKCEIIIRKISDVEDLSE